MALYQYTRLGGLAFLGAAAVALTVSSCATSTSGDLDASNIVADARQPTPDAAFCENLVCPGFTFCNATGVCEAYPPCNYPPTFDAGVSDASTGADASPNVDPPPPLCEDGFTCTNDICLPDDRDFDGDGYNADVDCDELNEDINPGAVEICNLVDDDCQNGVDDGDAEALCTSIDSGDVCNQGTCDCRPNEYDIDPAVPNCECIGSPALDQGTACNNPIDLGDFPDTGQMQTVIAKVLPLGREVWYKFRAVDNADTACDNFHVRAWLTDNPGNQFRIQVTRGGCGNSPDGGEYTDYNWYTDFRSTVGGTLAGQCPCTGASAARQSNISVCENDSSDYYVRVTRVDAAPVTCDSFTLEISNGLYDAI